MNDFMDDMDFQEGFEDGYQEEACDEEYCNDEFDDEIDQGEFDGTHSDNQDQGFFDEFTGRDAFYAGSLMGFAYEEGLIEAERRRLKKKKRGEYDE